MNLQIPLATEVTRNMPSASTGAMHPRYDSRWMRPVLNYDSRVIRKAGPGIGYALILTLNIVGLLAGGYLFTIETSGDAYAPLIGIVYGIPLIFGQIVFGALPARIYAARHRSVGRGATWTLLVISYLAPFVSACGVSLSLILPTHGSTC